MATSFAQDLGPTPTPVSVNEPIVNKGIATAITGLGNAANLRIANDTEDEIAALRSRGRTDQSLTPKELEAIDYPKLAAGLEQGVLGQDEFQARLDTNLRRMYALNPGRAKAYASFAGGVRATLTPAGADKIDTPEEAQKAGVLKGIEEGTKQISVLATQLGISNEAAFNLNAEAQRRTMEQGVYDYRRAVGGAVGADMQQEGFKILPAWATGALTQVMAVAAQNGGTIPPAQLGLVRARALADLDNKWNEFSSSLPAGSDVSALRTAFDQRRSGLNTFIDQMDASKVTEGEKNVAVNMLATRGTEALTDLYMINKVAGQEGVRSYMQMTTNPDYVDQIKKNNPAFGAWLEQTGSNPDAAWNPIAIKLGRGDSVASLSPQEQKVVGQGGVNALASPAFNNKKDDVFIPRATELVKSGDIGIVKAFWTPNGLVKLRAPGEVGDYYRKQYQSMIDSVKASTITELAGLSGTIAVDKNQGNIRYLPSGSVGSGLELLGSQVMGLGTSSIQRKLDLLNEYATKTPELVDSTQRLSPREAQASIMEDINKRLTTIKAGGTKAPDTTTHTPATSGGVIKVDDNGVVIP